MYKIYIYIFGINNLQWLMYHKTKPNQEMLLDRTKLCTYAELNYLK